MWAETSLLDLLYKNVSATANVSKPLKRKAVVKFSHFEANGVNNMMPSNSHTP